MIAWDHEVPLAESGDLFTRTVLGEPILLLRTGAGRFAALEDRCCHRLAPLSKGRREGDCVRCDNLLDFSHLSYVHDKTFGGSTAIAQAVPAITMIDGPGQQGIRVIRRVPNVPPPPFYLKMRSFDSALVQFRHLLAQRVAAESDSA